ncbi:hypothetical protein TNCV_2124251 [Trichonephila clavipes]|uniref:Uncharacterized protein n=1 Tax=Trichonephila clavipes TaxID=2585209 RepID=A0A8X6UTB7_TRICX|nr:hypothetical protein TNCV_2124251 [Trichonephila clavipes]
MNTKYKKTRESLQKHASEIERLANMAFTDSPTNVREMICLQYFVHGLKDAEVQRTVPPSYDAIHEVMRQRATRADPEIELITKFKEASYGKPSCQVIASFHTLQQVVAAPFGNFAI